MGDMVEVVEVDMVALEEEELEAEEGLIRTGRGWVEWSRVEQHNVYSSNCRVAIQDHRL